MSIHPVRDFLSCGYFLLEPNPDGVTGSLLIAALGMGQMVTIVQSLDAGMADPPGRGGVKTIGEKMR
jgi:hypothetical protein